MKTFINFFKNYYEGLILGISLFIVSIIIFVVICVLDKKKNNKNLEEKNKYLFRLKIITYVYVSLLIYNISKELLSRAYTIKGFTLDPGIIIKKFIFTIIFYILVFTVIFVKAKLMRAAIFFITTVTQLLVYAYIFEDFEVVYLSWVLILSGIASFMLYSEIVDISVDKDLKKLKSIGDSNDRYKFGKLLHEETKLVYDKVVYAFFSLFAILITEIAIVWSAYEIPKYNDINLILMFTVHIIIGFILSMALFAVGWMAPIAAKLAEIKNIIIKSR